MIPAGIVVEQAPNPACRTYHCRKRLTSSDKDTICRLAAQVDGVEQVLETSDKYELTVVRGHCFKWEEIEEKLGPIMEEHMTEK